MTDHGYLRNFIAAALLGLLFLLAACGGEGGSLFDGLATPEFWALDMGNDSYYRIGAREAGSGRYCRIYVETGQNVSQAAVDNIVSQFDNVIYPSVSAAFGSPPNPGIDGDPRITLLLLDIRNSGTADGGVVSGYFSPVNEYPQADLNAAGFSDKSNAREMIYLNIASPGPASAKFLRIVAHEFQHMVHWEQKTHRLSTFPNFVTDDTWLNEAMSESAPFFCGYGSDSDRVAQFARAPSDSLTIWDGNLADYGAVYMWSQYLYDRYPRTLFRTALSDNAVGIASISNALAGFSVPNTSKTFAGLFFDWTMANLVALESGLNNTAGLRPEWQYATSLSLASVFAFSPDRINPPLSSPLRQWSADYYQFRRTSLPISGTVTWVPGDGQTSASFICGNAPDNTVTSAMVPGTAVSYTSKGYMVVRNESGIDNATNSGGAITVTPSILLGALMQAPPGAVRTAEVAAPGGASVKCGSDRFEQRERAIRARGLRARF